MNQRYQLKERAGFSLRCQSSRAKERHKPQHDSYASSAYPPPSLLLREWSPPRALLCLFPSSEQRTSPLKWSFRLHLLRFGFSDEISRRPFLYSCFRMWAMTDLCVAILSLSECNMISIVLNNYMRT